MVTDINVINENINTYRAVVLSKKRPKLKKLFKMFNITPHKMQEDVIDVWDNKYKEKPFLMLSSGRRVGKSVTAALIATLEMLIPGASIGLVSPSEKQLGIIFNQVIKNIKALGLPIEKQDINKKVLILKNGAELIGGSEKTVENLEGRAYSLLIIDEGALLTRFKQIFDSLTPSLATYGVYEDTKTQLGRIVLIGTPKRNAKDYYNLYQKALLDSKWFVGQYPSSVNPINTKDFLEQQKEILDEKTYLQEYEAQWVFVTDNLVFKDFSINKNLFNKDKIIQVLDKDSVVIGGLDIGATDFTAYVLVYKEGGKYYVFDYFEVNNSSEAEIAHNIKMLESQYNIDVEFRYIDPSAKLTRIGLQTEHDILCYPAINPIKEGVALLNQLFRQQKLFIAEDLINLIQQLQEIEWSNTKSGDPFKKPKIGHYDVIHALRYAVYTDFKLSTNQEIVVL